MLESFFIIITCIYFLQFTLLSLGIRRASHFTPYRNTPVVSILVAARNEEENITDCIASLIAAEYPQDKKDIILINDSSRDRTGEIMRQYANSHQNVIYVEIDRDLPHIRGKANALAQGVKYAQGEILLFTDADCRVPPTWIKKQISYCDEKTGIVGGFTRLTGKGWFSGLQSLDWFFLYSLAAATIGIGKPFTAVGNNLCVRRAAYDEVGGYEKLPFSVTEDYILVNAIKETRRWHIRFPLDSETLVESRPCPDLRTLYRQKHRWASGGIDMDPFAFFFFAPSFLLNYLIVLFPLLGISPLMVASAFLIKMVSDILFIVRPLYTLHAIHLYRYILHFEILHLIYVLLLPFQIVLSRKVIWKERKYEKKKV